jgi:uncharacterized membrane protein YeaQ/YmgE (transglycosylase-associated protein family)
MGLVTWMVLGLVVGALARVLMPGKDAGGLLATLGIGVAGAFVGGYLGTELGFGDVTGFNLPSVVLATAGALLLLFGWRTLRGRA